MAQVGCCTKPNQFEVLKLEVFSSHDAAVLPMRTNAYKVSTGQYFCTHIRTLEEGTTQSGFGLRLKKKEEERRGGIAQR